MILCPHDLTPMNKTWECCSLFYRYECPECGRLFLEEPSWRAGTGGRQRDDSQRGGHLNLLVARSDNFTGQAGPQ
ncbi:MAG: hypothetical protein A2902_03570 [Elusimicrobia bacterium RIFCSPLOWO2_01_FULL_64_13]|nr:MAG: hypothetical protein A2902_03570 [Elusimicrobia bacterium RIFCSPLOWO2_01_FULL_64_13]